MFDPIKMATEIKDSYVDYITTTFSLADKEYEAEFRKELQKDGAVARGPYIDIGGSYETEHTLNELIHEHKISSLFSQLEPVSEKERELKLDRPLYRHQEVALLKAAAGENLVVTTGTGSGKTESFLLPIINHLLREQEAGTLSAGVRAIIIYPMNALANDQMKRMRALFKRYPQICYGVYNGNTEHTQSKAISEYRRTYHDADGNPLDPAPNEIISREVMQRTPPHILITNYSMLEYMMLRPKDDAVFSGAKLKYIVLDEAHIYKGATGMETSLLMRRLRARISEPDSVQYILTSATLGGPEADDEILGFADKLCGVPFKRSGIVRSTEKKAAMEGMLDFSPDIFTELQQAPSISGVLERYNADFAPNSDDGEKLFEFFLHSRLFAALRKAAQQPITVSQLRKALSDICPITNEQIVDFIAVCAKAEKDGASLIKPRYHFFIRALEGAYITLNTPKRLFLQRKHFLEKAGSGEGETVFEAAVCSDCGRLAIVGQMDGGYLVQSSRKGEDDSSSIFYLKNSEDEVLLDDDSDEDEGENDYVVCPVCGAISSEADLHFKPLCEHNEKYYRHIYRVEVSKRHGMKCPACSFGSFRRFYLGSEAATAVLGTELFEQLPSEEVIVQSDENQGATSGRRSLFAKAVQPRKIRKKIMPQFLCFSDSRSEAAFFASYMERSYGEFLRRRGIWHVAEKYRSNGVGKVGMFQFVDELSRYFENNRSFVEWNAADTPDMGRLAAQSRSNAWVAVLNEMFNARRGTSLVSMGVLSFEYRRNESIAFAFQNEPYNLSSQEAKDLLNLLSQDAVFAGAIDAGQEYTLSAAEREYIFFSPNSKKLVLVKAGDDAKKSWLTGWRGRCRENGSYYPNTRLIRLSKALDISYEEADEILGDYWFNVFQVETDEFVLNANDFDICIGGTEGSQFYRCKKCGRITPYNVKNMCSSVKCSGTLEAFDPLAASSDNHYARLYRSERSDPLYIKEHTAQLAKDQQTLYQEAFVHKKINALSCSTTFEMGVDVGSLETVYMRDVPPSPANYVQRAGRAGRAKHSAAFVMTFAKLSSHDFTYYDDPTAMISGKIKAPVFEIENEKILNRHIFAVALSSFFAVHSEVYDGDNQSMLLNEGGYELLKDYLATKPQDLQQLLINSIPAKMHRRLGIVDFGWVDRLCGPEGVLELAVQDFRRTVDEMQKELSACRRRKDDEAAGMWSRNLRNFRCAKEDNAGKKSLIGFLVRNNVLPKYGFPVDTVELIPDINSVGRGKSLQLARDLQMAIAEYAPGAQVVADGKMYISRYIRKMPGKNTATAWEQGFYCPSCPSCNQANFTKDPVPSTGRECVSCHTPIKRMRWLKTIEPRMGFCAEKEARAVPMHRPMHDFKTDDYYIGDPHRNLIAKQSFIVNDQVMHIESTANDSLVVVGQSEYRVCPVCGYATEGPMPTEHKTVRGYRCANQESKASSYRLSHDFKTDVARITFESSDASNRNAMLSVLYVLLEGLSREMGIERTDIKGCLFYTSSNGFMVYSLVLYDAVAGGAGHVRRIVTDDGAAFQRVLKRAISVVDGCDCDSSCYRCLRNYYNQKIHDLLSRKQASSFLHHWLGDMHAVPADDIVPSE